MMLDRIMNISYSCWIYITAHQYKLNMTTEEIFFGGVANCWGNNLYIQYTAQQMALASLIRLNHCMVYTETFKRCVSIAAMLSN